MGLKEVPKTLVEKISNLEGWRTLTKRRSFLSRTTKFWFPPRGRVVYDLTKLLDIYKQEPMAQRAVDKKSKDLFEAGFEIKGVEPEEKIYDELTEFVNDRKIRLKWKLSRCARDAMVYGNGFMELIYADDTAKHDQPPNGNDIVDIVPISPLQTIIVEDLDPDSEEYGKISGYLFVSPEYIMGWDWKTYPYLAIPKSHSEAFMLRGRTLHPDRIVHMKFNSLSDSHVGISLLEPAYNIMRSKVDGEKVFGTIITRYAKPILEAVIKSGTPDEIKKAGKILHEINKRYDEVGYLAHDDAWETKVPSIQGAILNPEPYTNYLTEQIAIGFGVPKALLVGSEAGAISGSTLNLISYFQSLETDQETILTPIVLRILDDLYFARHNRALPKDIEIIWNKLYSDEIAGAKSDFMGLQNVIHSYEKGLLPKIPTRKKISEITGIEYSDKEEDYEKPKPPSIGLKGFPPFGGEGRQPTGGPGEKPPGKEEKE